MTPLTKQAVEGATGRALDSLVHVHVMGLPEDKMLMEFPTITPEPDGSTGLAEWMNYARAYSTDGNAMLAVLEKMQERDFSYSLYPTFDDRKGYGSHGCRFVDLTGDLAAERAAAANADGLPLAVARCALLAIAQREESA